MKDPKQFRERFKKWKEGTPIEEIYDNGRPTYFESVELLASPMAKNWNNIKGEFKPSAKYVGTSYSNGKDDRTYVGGSNQELVVTPLLSYAQPIASKDHYIDYQFYSPTGNSIVQTINSTPRWQQYWADQEASRVSNAMHQASPKVLDLLTAVDAVATGPEMLEGLYGLYNLAKRRIYAPYKVSRAIDKIVRENPIITAYNRNPAIKDLGSLLDYQLYLYNTFPNSKYKQILWHGSRKKDLLLFSTEFIGSNVPLLKGSTGIYLAPERATAANYGKKGGVYPVLLNTENPYVSKLFLAWPTKGVNVAKISPKMRNTALVDYDAVIAPLRGEIAFFEPDNALILGSNKDVRGFKDYMLDVSKKQHRLNPNVRTRIGDVEVDNPNLLYHLDRGDNIGAFSNHGAFVKEGKLFPGTPKDNGSISYSWWNKGKPYATHINGEPMTRLMTTTEDTPGMLHVRSQKYPIGQWDGKKGLVTKAEYVNSNPVDVEGSIYMLDPDYGYRRVIPNVPTAEFKATPRISKITEANAASITPEQWTAAQDIAIARGDMVEAQRLRDLHFIFNAPRTVALTKGKPLTLYHGTNNRFNIFDLNKFKSTDGGTFGRGIYTTPVKSYADLYGDNTMSLYMKLDNPRDYREYTIADLFGQKLAFGDDFATGNGIDGVIGRPSWKGFKGLEEYVSHNPRNIKSADAVTYDEDGIRIPLGLRDNFKDLDIRYGLIPLGLGLGASTLYNNYARGKDSSIYIKPSKRGTFTAAAKKRGMSVLSFASKVLNNPSNYSKAMRKKALFAKNASKFKH